MVKLIFFFIIAYLCDLSLSCAWCRDYWRGGKNETAADNETQTITDNEKPAATDKEKPTTPGVKGIKGTHLSCDTMKYEGIQYTKNIIETLTVGTLDNCLDECVKKQPQCKGVSHEKNLQNCALHSSATTNFDKSNSQRSSNSTCAEVDCDTPFHKKFEELMKVKGTPPPIDLKSMSPELTFMAKNNLKKNVIITDFSQIAPTVATLKSESYLETGRQVVFLVHGLMDNGGAKWILDMASKIIDVENSLIIITSWPNGAMTNKNKNHVLALLDNYAEAAANTQTVAEVVAKISKAISQSVASAAYFYCIGYSMGVHICGQASRAGTKFDRITAMDAAKQIFHLRPDLSLQKDSAGCIDAIHSGISDSSSPGFGTDQAVGHADYFLYGGSSQPNCAKPEKKPMLIVLCNHYRSVQKFNESITQKNVCPAFGPCPAGTGRFADKCKDNNGEYLGYFSTCHKAGSKREGEYYVAC